MGRKLYISDLHLGHINVTKAGKDFDKRGFKDLDEMHEFITRKWNANVSSGDQVYILGDVCWQMNGKNFGAYKELLNNLNGNKHLILGNHDKGSLKKLQTLYVVVSDYAETQDIVSGVNKRVILSHYYMPFYNHHYRDAIMLHGHSHNSAESEMERRITAMLNRQGYPCEIYNVGCMYPYIDYAPRTLQYIVDNYDSNVNYSRTVQDDDNFDNIIQAMSDYHSQHPHLRFGQSVVNTLGVDPFYMSDKEALQKICSQIKNHSEVKNEI